MRIEQCRTQLSAGGIVDEGSSAVLLVRLYDGS
jgi:hypothetical protein